MKAILSTIVIIIVFSSCIAQKVSEVDAIKNIIRTSYVEGLLNEGNYEKIDKGFHPDFELLGIGEGDEMWRYSILDWKKSVKRDLEEGKLPRKGINQVSVKFLSVDIVGTVAVAKFEFYEGERLVYIDYQSLYKFESGWKIVSKVFYKF